MSRPPAPHHRDEARLAELRGLVERLGLPWRPEAAELIDQALVHASYAKEHDGQRDNERLEFLGDNVIGLLVAARVFRDHPDDDEGRLSRRRHLLVSREVLGELAGQLGIGPLLVLGAGEDKMGGRQRESVLGGAFEALMGALHLRYSWEELASALGPTVLDRLVANAGGRDLVDHKSRFQEWCQQTYHREPLYRVTAEQGPDHARTFTVEAVLNGTVVGVGSGSRKQFAEREAARDALARISAPGAPAPPPPEAR